MGTLQVKIEDLDMKECVVYQSLEDKKVWVRPLEDFMEKVKNEEGGETNRFIKIC